MTKITLYYFPGSYYSQKAYLALVEKEADFKTVAVNIHGGEQMEPWYMRLNPNGSVPTLVDGGKVVYESERIIEYVDKQVTGTTLVPPLDTTIGQEVDRFRKLLDSVKIDLITPGVLCHRELAVGEIHVPTSFMSKEAIKTRIGGYAEQLGKLAEKHADLREAYLTKQAKYGSNIESILNKDLVSKHLDDLENVCDKLEEQLKKVNEGNKSENWLLGPRFTAADITLTVFLDRMKLLGLQERYFPVEKRPYVHAYREQLGYRKSVQKLRENAKLVAWYYLKYKVKKVLPYVGCVAAVGLAAGVAYIKIRK